MLKCVAEVGELADEVAKGRDVREELGDVLVTLIMVSALEKTTLTECLRTAVEKIERRSGRMVNGTFVKSGD
jgi:NTP pyrophosphatase (non-canonical NTP hydrolase)